MRESRSTPLAAYAMAIVGVTAAVGMAGTQWFPPVARAPALVVLLLVGYLFATAARTAADRRLFFALALTPLLLISQVAFSVVPDPLLAALLASSMLLLGVWELAYASRGSLRLDGAPSGRSVSLAVLAAAVGTVLGFGERFLITSGVLPPAPLSEPAVAAAPVVALVAVIEETYFRGLVLRKFIGALGLPGSLVIVSLLSSTPAMLSGNPVLVMTQFGLSIVLGAAYAATRGVMTPAIVHIAHDILSYSGW